MRTALAASAIALLGVWVLWGATDGARAFTAEGARRLSVQEQPRELPPILLQDQHGEHLRLAELQGKLVVLDFIYTRCADLCVAVGNSLQTIRDRLPAASLGAEVMFVSISFDPQRDTPDHLAYYAKRHGARRAHWRVTRVAPEQSLDALLELFGVKVLPDGWGGYQHNSAIYLLDRAGRLVRIFDYDAPAQVLAHLEARL